MINPEREPPPSENDPRFHDLVPKLSEDDIHFMSDELAELRELISRNEKVVFAGGPIIAWWGLCSAIAGLWNFVEQFGHLPVVWVGPFNLVAGMIGMTIIVWKMGTVRVLKPEFQAITSVWYAVFLSTPLFIAGLYFRAVDSVIVMTAIQALLFAIATAVSAVASRKKWLMIPAIGWWGASALMFFVVTDFWRPLVYSISSLAFMTAPGLMLYIIQRRERR